MRPEIIKQSSTKILCQVQIFEEVICLKCKTRFSFSKLIKKIFGQNHTNSLYGFKMENIRISYSGKQPRIEEIHKGYAVISILFHKYIVHLILYHLDL